MNLLIVPVVALTTSLLSGSAAADTPGCVSHAEYDNLDRGLSVQQVSGRFDTNGWYIGATGDRFRRGYDPCWSDTRKVVVFYSLTNGLSVDWDIRDA